MVAIPACWFQVVSPRILGTVSFPRRATYLWGVVDGRIQARTIPTMSTIHTIPYSYMIVRTTKQGGPAQHFVSGRPPGKASIIHSALVANQSRDCALWRMRPHLPASLPRFLSLRGDEEGYMQHATRNSLWLLGGFARQREIHIERGKKERERDRVA